MFKPLISLLLSGCMIVATAGDPSIGTVKSAGDFRIDGSTIRGNATVFEGDLIETASVRSVVQFSSTEVTMAPDSRAKLYRDHVVLEKGMGLVRDGENQVIEAGTLRIASGSKGSLLQIETFGPNKVGVAARIGSAEVRNGAGVLVARVNAGLPIVFGPQANASTITKVTGVVGKMDGKYLLTDTVTNVTVEIRGKDLGKYAGKEVSVTGTTIPGATPVAGATQVVEVTRIERAAIAAPGGVHTTAIVVGVTAAAVIGAVAGLGAEGVFGSGPAVSRQ